jgi:Right handed beta helix region
MRVAVVGSGLAGFTAYQTLRRGGFEPAEIAVFGTDADPVETWRLRAAAIRQREMRSESDGHCLPTSFPGLALQSVWRRRSLMPLLATVADRYHPTVPEFLDHVQRLRARSGWDESVRLARIESVRAVDGGFELGGGTFPHVLLATGHPGLNMPDELAGDPRAVHTYEPHDYAPTVTVIGAGLAAATEWLNALEAGSEVVSVRRRRVSPAAAGGAGRDAPLAARPLLPAGAALRRAGPPRRRRGPLPGRAGGERDGAGDRSDGIPLRLAARPAARGTRRGARARDRGGLDRARARLHGAGADRPNANAVARRHPGAVGVSGRGHAGGCEVRGAPLPREGEGMSYTLRGRIDSRLTALLPVLLAACALAGALRHWWPVELVVLMAAVGVAFDLQIWHRLLPYQPAWAMAPLGAVELGALMAIVYGFGLHAPLGPALALFAAGWLAAAVCAQAGFPLLRLGYAEDGGELGRLGSVATGGIALALAACAATYYVRLPPVVHLAAGVHQGPLVVTQRENLVGDPGAVVRGGIVVRHDDVHIGNLTVVGGENGITVDGVHGTQIDNVSISGAKMDGIHVRLADVMVKNCTIDMLGNPNGQGIDISFNMNMGMSMVEGCTVTGGMVGITTHSSMTDIVGNKISRTQQQAISVTEMSMGMAMDNEIQNALGVALYCNDRSMCTFERNTVVGTRNDSAGGDASRRGFGLLASFQSEADVKNNRLAANPVPMGTITNSIIRPTGWKP